MQFLTLTPWRAGLELGILIFVGFMVWMRWQDLRRLGHSGLAMMVRPSQGIRLSMLRWILWGIAVVLVGLGLWGPWFGSTRSVGTLAGADIIFTVDVSMSMQAMDMPLGRERISRLEAVKASIEQYVRSHPEHRYGMVVFAGDRYVLSPLTSDSEAFLTLVSQVSPDLVGVQGTDVGGAIGEALLRFKTTDGDRGRVVVVLTDGGDEVITVPEEVVIEGVEILVYGVGDSKPVPIPMGVDVFGREQYKTYRGSRVETLLQDDLLVSLTETLGGLYQQLRKDMSLNQLNTTISRVPLSQHDAARSEKMSDYPVFVWSGFGLFAVGLLLPIIWRIYARHRRYG